MVITYFGYCPLYMAMLITKWLLAIVHGLLVLAIDIYTRAILGMVITNCPLSMFMLKTHWLWSIGHSKLAMVIGYWFRAIG